MSSPISLLALNGTAQVIASRTERLRPAGFQSEGELNRFQIHFSNHCRDLPKPRQPNRWVFDLIPGSVDAPLPSPAKMRLLMERLSTANRGHKVLCVDTDAEIHAEVDLPADVGERLSGGKWREQVVTELSRANPRRCFCLVHNTMFRTYLGGALFGDELDPGNPFARYVDALAQRRAWHPEGKCLAEAASTTLVKRGRLGVWLWPQYHVLRHAPEKLIQDLLQQHFNETLLHYVEIIPERDVEQVGTVDFQLVLANGYKFFIEIKWIGRSAKAEHENSNPTPALKRALRQWANGHVTVVEFEHAKTGVAQLEQYMGRHGSQDFGYLAVYDFRLPAQAQGSEAASAYPAPTSVYSNQIKVVHACVDPRTASQSARAQRPVVVGID